MKSSEANQSRQVTAVATLSVISNTLLVVLKVVVGVLIGSVSVISEGIHSGIDLLAAIIALFAVRQASKPADDNHPYGHGKFENVSGTVEAVLIFVAAAWIVVESVDKFRNPRTVEEPGWGVALMLISAILNLVVSEILFRVGRKAESVALEADGWHLRTDVYTSLGVMFGLFVIWGVGKLYPSVNVQWIDPVAAIFVAVLIVKAAYELTVQAGRDLFDVSLPEQDLDLIKSQLQAHAEVKGFHHLRTRKAGKDRFVEFHLVVDPKLSVLESHRIAHEISDAIKSRIAGIHVTIHVEPCDMSCSSSCLAGCLLKPESLRV